MNKFELVRSILEEKGGSGGKLLDVGCRGCELKPHVENIYDYEGLDLFQNEEKSVKYVMNIEDGTNFSDGTFDVVVALDVIEHLNDMRQGLLELYRVSKRSMLIMLPNLAHILFRYRFAKTGRLNAKYDLKYDMGLDRHRWLTIADQTDSYMQDFARDQNCRIEIIRHCPGSRTRAFGRIARTLGLGPNIWSWTNLYVLDKLGDAADVDAVSVAE